MNSWDQWVQQLACDGGLLQSSGWAEFQKRIGRSVHYIEVDQAKMVVIEQTLPLGQTYIYTPRGPVFENVQCQIESLKLLNNAAGEKFPQAIFWRMEPTYNNFQFPIPNFQFRSAPHNIQPATTLIIDLTKTEDELLEQMKQKTRYNIRVAQKYNIIVRREQNPELFLNLLEETAKRDEFRTHAREYYRKLLACHSRENGNPDNDHGSPIESGMTVELFNAFHNNTLLAGAIIAFFGPWAYYLHGASRSSHREMMAPHLLHWEIIREAKRRGCTKYDLWGAGDEWPGVSKFKTGFAPATPLTQYPGTFDVVLQPWKYWVYRFAQRLPR